MSPLARDPPTGRDLTMNAALSSTKRIDKLGRMVLPAELREQLGIREGDLIDVRVERNRLVLAKATQVAEGNG